MFLFSYLISCAEKTSYTGLILNDNINLFKYINKKNLINELGYPSHIDPIDNSYYYYTEKKLTKNLINNDIIGRTIINISFNKNDEIFDIKKYNLDDQKTVIISKDKTKNNLIKKGIIEKIFGGIGPQKSISNTP